MQNKPDCLGASVTTAVCASCDKRPRSNAYLYLCHTCDKYLCKACAKFVTTSSDDASKTTKICSECHSKPKISSKNSIEKTKVRRSNSMQTQNHTSNQSTSKVAPSGSENNIALASFMDEIRKLSSNLTTQIQTLDTKFETQLGSVSTQLKVLESIPNLFKRVEEVESELGSVKKELLDLR